MAPGQTTRGDVLVTLIVVTSANPGDGKTGVATAIGRRIAYGGTPVTLLRVRTADESESAASDAAWYGGLDFAPASTASTVEAASVTDKPGEVTIAEMGLADPIPDGATVIVVGRGNELPALPDGVSPALFVQLAVDPTEAAPPAEQDGIPVVSIPEDRTLAGFSVSEVRDLLGAEVLSEGDLGDPTCDHLVIAPIGSDSGLPYYDRFRQKAVLARYDRTDMVIAAVRSEPNCVVLTGGRYPSDYVYDVVRATGVPLMLSFADTESTVIALEELWDRTRFQGEYKLDRMDAMLEAGGLYDRLLPLLNEAG